MSTTRATGILRTNAFANETAQGPQRIAITQYDPGLGSDGLGPHRCAFFGRTGGLNGRGAALPVPRLQDRRQLALDPVEQLAHMASPRRGPAA